MKEIVFKISNLLQSKNNNSYKKETSNDVPLFLF